VEFDYLDEFYIGLEQLQQGNLQAAKLALTPACVAGVAEAIFFVGLIHLEEGDIKLAEDYLNQALSKGHRDAAEAIEEMKKLPEYHRHHSENKDTRESQTSLPAKRLLLALSKEDKIPFKLPAEPWTQVSYMVGPISANFSVSDVGLEFNFDLGQYSSTTNSNAVGEVMVNRIPDAFPRSMISCGLQPQPRMTLNVQVPVNPGDGQKFIEFVLAETADVAINLLKAGFESGHLLSPSKSELMQFGLTPPTADHSSDPSAIRSASINWANEFAGTKILFNL